MSKRLTQDEFITRAKEIHGDKYDYSKVDYVDAHTKVCIICHKKDKNGFEHGEFWQTPCNHLNGKGCGICKASKLELEISSFLTVNNIKYIYQASKEDFKWLEKQKFDFYLPDYKVVIECQGKQHFDGGNFGSKNFNFKKIYNSDVKKKEKCEKHDLKIIYYMNLKDYKPFSIYTKDNCFFNKINILNYLTRLSL